MKRLLSVLCALVLASPVGATIYSGFKAIPTDSANVIAKQYVNQPTYSASTGISWITNPLFNDKVARIQGSYGESFHFSDPAWSSITGTWGQWNGHHYSKIQPWSSDGRWFLVDFDKSVKNLPYSKLILDAENGYLPYKPLAISGRGGSVGKIFKDCRWYYRSNHPWEMVGILDTSLTVGGVLARFNIITGEQTGFWRLPDSLGKVDGGAIGKSEGNLSTSGRWLAVGMLSNSDTTLKFCIVDLDSITRGPASNGVGPVLTLPPSGLEHANLSDKIDNWSVSPTGGYLVVKYGGVAENNRVFHVDTLANPTWGTVTPVSYASPKTGTGLTGEAAGICNVCGVYATMDTILRDTTGLNLQATGYGLNGSRGGWITMLSHADFADSAGSEFYVGGYRCKDGSHQKIYAVNLATGVSHSLLKEIGSTSATKTVGCDFTSGRATDRSGWTYCSMDVYTDSNDNTKFLASEIIAIALDSDPVAPTLQRFGTLHSNYTQYEDEPHPVPNASGKLVCFRSDWTRWCGTPAIASTQIDAGNIIRRSTTASSGAGSFGCGPSTTQSLDYIIDASCGPAGAVSALTVGTVGTTSLQLTWNDPAANSNEFYDADIINVYANVYGSAGPDTLAATVTPNPGGANSVSLTGLNVAGCYLVKVKPVSNCGEGTATSIRVGTTSSACDGEIYYTPPPPIRHIGQF